MTKKQIEKQSKEMMTFELKAILQTLSEIKDDLEAYDPGTLAHRIEKAAHQLDSLAYDAREAQREIDRAED